MEMKQKAEFSVGG